MSWTFLILAGIFEIAFTTSLKMSGGFSFNKPGYIVIFTCFALVSFGFLNLAMRGISLGTAYAVWTGMGAFGTAIIGYVWFGDSMSFLKIVFLTMLIVSIIGLKAVS
jgi:quaternary ammonium compound-resistance protein SugE